MEIKKEVQEIIENLKNINTLTDLSFKEITNISNDIIKVIFYGHEVGGSYIHDYQVTPKYIEDIEYTTNRKCVWTERKCGGFGTDLYLFDIHINNIVNKNKYVPKGKLLRAANSHLAFRSSGDTDWAIISILYDGVLNNKQELKNVGVEVKRKCLYIDNEKIAHIVEYEKPKYINNRQMFNESYDLLIEHRDLTNNFLKKYEELINNNLRKIGYDEICNYSHFSSTQHCGTIIKSVFNNGYEYSTNSDWNIITENSNNLSLLLSGLEKYVPEKVVEKVVELKKVDEIKETILKVEKETIELENYYTSDSKVFQLNVNELLTKLKNEALEYEKSYQYFLEFKKTKPEHEILKSFDPEKHNLYFYDNYDYNYFAVDPEKLKEYKSENWEHFKWEMFRHHVTQNTKNYNQLSYYKSDLNIMKYNNILTEEDFLKFVDNVFSDRNYKNIYNIKSSRLERFIFFHKSNLYKLYEDENDLIDNIISDKDSKEIITDLEYVVKILNFKILPKHIAKSMIFASEERFLPGCALSRKDIISDDTQEIIMEYKDKNQYNKKHIFYYTSHTKKIVDFLLDNYVGDYNEIIPSVINSANKSYYLYMYCKNNKIKLDLHNEDLHKLLYFIQFWFENDININFTKDTFYYHKHNYLSTMIFNEKVIKKELLEKYFMQYKYSNDGNVKSEKMKNVEKILLDSGIAENKLLYFMTVIQRQNYHFKDKINDIKHFFKNSKYYIECGGGYCHIDNNTPLIFSRHKNKDNLTDKELKEKYLKKYFYNDSFIKEFVYDIYSDINETTLSDEAKYHVRKTKEHHYYLKVKDGEFILGLIHNDYRNAVEKMPFEIFCEIVESVSLKYKENELLKELNELEKAKKDIEEKIEKLKK